MLTLDGAPVASLAVSRTSWIMSPSLRRAIAVGVVTLTLLSCESAIQPEPQLSVSIIGRGRITSSPLGIDCTAGQTRMCTSSFPAGTAVSLTMAAEVGREFGSWGGECGGVDGCVVKLDVSSSVSATFLAQPVLSVTIVGGRRVTSSPVGIDCRTGQNGTCAAPFPEVREGQAMAKPGELATSILTDQQREILNEARMRSLRAPSGRARGMRGRGGPGGFRGPQGGPSRPGIRGGRGGPRGPRAFGNNRRRPQRRGFGEVRPPREIG
jgi:hypothetical protein